MRVLAWFSCGDASAVAAQRAVQACGVACEVCYCDTFAYEHPDNHRFFADVQTWIGQPITILASPDYTDIYDVFRRTRWLVGPAGARCTTELKKNVRTAYQRPDDRHVFGYTAEERHRVDRLRQNHPDLDLWFPLVDEGLTKADCHAIVREAGIAIPAMYRLGYQNNNCIGCVKGGIGYWQRIRHDFPDHFAHMAAMEREIGAACLSNRSGGERVPLYLDELGDTIDHQPVLDFDCGPLCQVNV